MGSGGRKRKADYPAALTMDRGSAGGAGADRPGPSRRAGCASCPRPRACPPRASGKPQSRVEWDNGGRGQGTSTCRVKVTGRGEGAAPSARLKAALGSNPGSENSILFLDLSFLVSEMG